MGHGPEHHIEHAEHAAHATHDTFDKKVTISIAIVAAVLAAVTMLSHRAHNETLSLQNHAAMEQNLATNKWGEYQAYNIRSHVYQGFTELGEFAQSMPGKEEKFQSTRKRWLSQVDKYENVNMPRVKSEAETHQQSAKTNLEESHHMHLRSARFDLGELFLQLGVVFCSLAILTRARLFWYIGLLLSVLGLAIALTGHFDLYLDHGHDHAHPHNHHPTPQKAAPGHQHDSHDGHHH